MIDSHMSWINIRVGPSALRLFNVLFPQFLHFHFEYEFLSSNTLSIGVQERGYGYSEVSLLCLRAGNLFSDRYNQLFSLLPNSYMVLNQEIKFLKARERTGMVLGNESDDSFGNLEQSLISLN